MTMRSIRHSLIVYFLLLLTAALGAVSWTSYRTTAQALRERQRDSQKIIEAQYQSRVQGVQGDLDGRILRQARLMASLTRSLTVHFEGFHALGALGAAALPQGYLNLPLWLAQGTHSPMTARLHRTPSQFIYIDSADDLLPTADRDHPQEYFQTYRRNGQPLQHSQSMGELRFTLDKKLRDPSALLTEQYDEVELESGIKVRRVTLKSAVPRYRMVSISWPWRGPLGGMNLKGSKTIPATLKWGGMGPRPTGFESITPTVIVQYASDLAPVQAKIREFQRLRDEQLSDLESTIGSDLQQLRQRKFWIVLVTLLALWIGSYVVIRIGLSPLTRMSDAVSQITPQNFQLPLNPRELPQELQPIALRLEDVLEHLHKAFAREKQAAADISHELRTPLAALMTNLELGLRKTRTIEEYCDILSECRASGQHMYQLVERLLTLARLDAGADQYRPREVDAIDITLQCADLIRPLAKARGVDLRLHLPDAITLHTDPNKLREVLTNLLHNAVEYNQPNGTIELSVERTDGHMCLEVRDTGIGIKPEVLEHIFERFYRADPSRHADSPHAGLGLAIVKSYIDLMGGTIRVASSDAGTVFTITLPILKSAAALETSIRSESAMITG